MDKPTILIVEDTDNILPLAQLTLGSRYLLAQANGGRSALRQMRDRLPDLILLDKNFQSAPDAELLGAREDVHNEGLRILEKLRQNHPHLPVLMITSFDDLQTARQVTGQPGCYFLEFRAIEEEPELLAKRVEGLLQNPLDRDALIEKYARHGLIGRSEAMLKVFEEIEFLARIPENVLIVGERGVGKELAARAVHFEGVASTGPFESLNCSALPGGLLESELFGYEEGAFTDAKRTKPGKVEAAAGGTLFLDEIGEIEPQIQPKLLRFVERKEFCRLGSTRTRTVDTRIVAATNRDLREATKNRTFREDLYDRLSVCTLEVPPLRQRKDDISVLIEHFLVRAAEQRNTPKLSVSGRMVEHLTEYPWPGNVRELENAIYFASALAVGTITMGDIAPRLGGSEKSALPCEQRNSHGQCTILSNSQLKDIEKEAMRQTLERCDGNTEMAWTSLGMSKSSFYEKVAEYGLKNHLRGHGAG